MTPTGSGGTPLEPSASWSLLAPAVRDRLYALGLDMGEPVVLASNYNLIVRLVPHPVVARISLVPAPLPALMTDGAREVDVARHLMRRHIRVTPPTQHISPGPYSLGTHVMTLWQHVESTRRRTLTPARLVERVVRLAHAMASYSAEVPALGAWHMAGQAADGLVGHPDVRVHALLDAYGRMDRRLASLGPGQLTPCHGDAHAGNLLPGPTGWVWTDFEDASRMPKFWDLASLVANPLMLQGRQHPLVRAAAERQDIQDDLPGWRLALAARGILGSLVNVWWSRSDRGDARFAEQQLSRIGPFLQHLERMDSER